MSGRIIQMGEKLPNIIKKCKIRLLLYSFGKFTQNLSHIIPFAIMLAGRI